MSVVKADRFTALKARVKAEMLRRNQSGSVAGYGGSAYDYAVAPAAGGRILTEHRDKLVTPMRAVNSDLVPESVGSVVRESELANLEARVTAWSARSMTDQSGTDCKSGCTGTCYTGCATGCSGCNGCSGCGSGCPSSCSGCGSGCPSGCFGCGSGCGSGCTGTCKTGCLGVCQDACQNGCSDGCSGECKGCQGTCSMVCMMTCNGSCTTGTKS